MAPLVPSATSGGHTVGVEVCQMRRRLAALTVIVGAFSILGVGVAQSAGATTLPALCVRQPTPIGQIQIGYCPR